MFRLHRHGAEARRAPFFLWYCADDAAFAAQSAGAAACAVTVTRRRRSNRQVLGDVRVVRRDVRPVARFPRQPETRRRHACDLPGRQRLDPGSGSRSVCARSKQSPYDGGLQDADPGPLAGQGRARGRARSPVSAIDMAPTILKAVGLKPPAGMAGRRPARRARRSPPGRPSLARSSLTTPSTSTTRRRAFATAGSSRATGS